MPYFVKKPVVIEARQWVDVNNPHEILEWINYEIYDQHKETPCLCRYAFYLDDKIVIPTLEGDMEASVGDWIIQGVMGEFYPCKHDIFQATYNFHSI